jgi:hypothetical protein
LARWRPTPALGGRESALRATTNRDIQRVAGLADFSPMVKIQLSIWDHANITLAGARIVTPRTRDYPPAPSH